MEAGDRDRADGSASDTSADGSWLVGDVVGDASDGGAFVVTGARQCAGGAGAVEGRSRRSRPCGVSACSDGGDGDSAPGRRARSGGGRNLGGVDHGGPDELSMQTAERGVLLAELSNLGAALWQLEMFSSTGPGYIFSEPKPLGPATPRNTPRCARSSPIGAATNATPRCPSSLWIAAKRACQALSPDRGPVAASQTHHRRGSGGGASAPTAPAPPAHCRAPVTTNAPPPQASPTTFPPQPRPVRAGRTRVRQHEASPVTRLRPASSPFCWAGPGCR